MHVNTKREEGISRILLCVLYIAHGITQRKRPDNNVRSAWHGLRCFSSGRSPLMMRLRKLVTVVGRHREATVKRITD